MIIIPVIILQYLFKQLLLTGIEHYLVPRMTARSGSVVVMLVVTLVVLVVIVLVKVVVLVVLVVLVVMSGEDARPHSPCRDLALSQPVSAVECDTSPPLTINLN